MPRDIVVVGASAGGLQALERLLADLPADLPAAVLTVLHISPTSKSYLPQILSRVTTLPVLHPNHALDLRRGHIYIAPPDRHLLCRNGVVEVGSGPKENRHRPAVDVLFRSAASEYGSRVVGIILSGTLYDGAIGLWQVKKHGGVAIVQSPEDAQFPGMPLSALHEVEVDYKVPLKEMGKLITQLCRGESPVAKPVGRPFRE